MTLPRLISFSGRKGSGKTELANVCLKYGYTIINFADNLKDLVCKCLEISRGELECWKDDNLRWDLLDKIECISKELQISSEIISNYCKDPFESIRQILQVLGTDVIRRYNPNWHVQKTISYIMAQDKNKKFCIGDCRFINEKKTIEMLGGECWFIIRPGQIKISNHISETELNWSFFSDKVIINSMERQDLVWRWENYLCKRKLDIETAPFVNSNLINFSFLYPNEKSIYLLGVFKGSAVFIKNNVLTIQNKKLMRIKYLKTELGKDYIINNLNSIDIYNPYIIENLKLWNIFNNTDKIPEQIKKNDAFIKIWLIGLIDSCGNITENTLTINLSQEILEFICEKFEICFSDVCKKGDKTLFNMFLEKETFNRFIKCLGEFIHIGLLENWGYS